MYAGQEQAAQMDKYPDSARITAEKPRLQQQIDQLEKVLSGCHEFAESIEGVADRILGATPKAVGKDSQPTPPPSTVEQRLAAAIGFAEMLAARLHNAQRRLASAA